MCSIILGISVVAGRLLSARGASHQRPQRAMLSRLFVLSHAIRYAQRCLKAINRDAPQSWGCPYNAISTMGQR